MRTVTHRIVLVLLLFPAATLAGCGGSSGGGGASDTTAPAVTKTIPDNGGALLPGDSVTVNFNEPIKSGKVVLGGDMAPESDGGTVTKSAGSARGVRIQSVATGTTLTIAPQTTWTPGSDRTLTVDAKDRSGNSIPTLTLTYNIVEGIVYVSTPANGGDDTHAGTKDSPMDTIQAALAESLIQAYSPGAVFVSEGTYEVNSGMVSIGLPTYVILREGISVYGGYTSNFAERDPEAHLTTIQDISTAAATFSAPNRAIEGASGVTAATRIDGFTIQGGGGDYSSGVFTRDGGSPTIAGNFIDGGEGNNESMGICNNSSSPSIQNNTIHGGAGASDSTGINNLGSSPSIQNNTIHGGAGGLFSNGIYNRSSTPSIQHNIIDGGAGGLTSNGIYNINASPSIQNNTIHGGAGGSASYGISNFGESSNSSTDPSIQNNTINGGAGGSASYGISTVANVNSSSAPSIQNNIVFTSGSGEGYCIDAEGSNYNPESVQNNDLFNCLTALYRNGSVNLDTISAVNTLANTTSGGNVSVDPAFADLTGPDNDINTMPDNDWHLSSSSPTEVTQGGLDLSADFTEDKDGKTRTDPWSMGAYEQDN